MKNSAALVPAPRNALYHSAMPFGRRYAFLLAFITVLFPTSLAAISLRDLFLAASSAGQGISVPSIDLELAALRLRKARLEARTESARLNAESAFASSEAAYRKALLALLDDLVDTAFAAAEADLDASSAALEMENAGENRKYAESRYRAGLLSLEELRTAELELRTGTTDHELALWTFQDARDAFRFKFGKEWDLSLLPELPGEEPGGTIERWIGMDASLRLLGLSERMAETALAELPANAPGFDRTIKATELSKAREASLRAESASRRAYDSIRRKLKNQDAVLQIRREESGLSAISSGDARERYDCGLISLSARNLQRIAELDARKRLLLAWKAYLKTLGEYSINLGADPLGADPLGADPLGADPPGTP